MHKIKKYMKNYIFGNFIIIIFYFFYDMKIVINFYKMPLLAKIILSNK